MSVIALVSFSDTFIVDVLWELFCMLHCSALLLARVSNLIHLNQMGH